jgi:hypothetical protein
MIMLNTDTFRKINWPLSLLDGFIAFNCEDKNKSKQEAVIHLHVIKKFWREL